MARFVPLWGVWLVVTNVAVALFVTQNGIFRGNAEINLAAILAVLNGAVLAARELACSRGVSWLQGKWTRLPLVFAVLYALLIPVLSSIVDYEQEYVFSLLIGLAGGAFIYWFYRFRTRDMWCFSAACLFWAIVIEAGLARIVFDDSARGGAFEIEVRLLFMAVFTVVLFAGACWHVMKVLKEPAAETENTAATGGEKDA